MAASVGAGRGSLPTSSKAGIFGGGGSAKTTERPLNSFVNLTQQQDHPLLIQRQPAVSAQLHPLVALIISDHFNRACCNAQFNANNAAASKKPAASGKNVGGPVIVGALLGKQDGRHIEITNAVELRYDIIDSVHGPDDIIIDTEFWREKEIQFKQVFPDTDYVGWYIADGNEPSQAYLTERDVQIHQQIMQLHENPLMLKYRPQLISDAAAAANANSVDLFSAGDEVFPFELFESVSETQRRGSATPAVDSKGMQTSESTQNVVGNESKAVHAVGVASSPVKFVKIDYNFAIEESERIGITHIAGDAVGGEASDDVAMAQAAAAAAAGGGEGGVQSAALLRTYKSLTSSTRMLRTRMHVITEYLRAVQEGKIQPTSETGSIVAGSTSDADAAKSDAEKSTVLTDEKILKKISGINNKLKLLSRSHFVDAGYLENDMPAGHLVALLGCVNQTQMNLARFAGHTLPVLQMKESGMGGGRMGGGGGFTPYGFEGGGGPAGRSARRMNPPRMAGNHSGYGRNQRGNKAQLH